jgi:quinol monooxygenase YgiN
VSYVVRAQWTVGEGNLGNVRNALAELVPLSRQEPGNQVYQPYQAPDRPDVVHLFEVYDDEAAFRAHVDSNHFQRLVIGTVLPLLDDREVAVFHTLDA